MADLNLQLPHITPYESILRDLLKDDTFRETILKLDLSLKIDASFRHDFVTICIRILYGRLISRTNRRSTAKKDKKKAVFSFLATCVHEEIKEFIDILTLPFSKTELSKESLLPAVRKQLGFLTLLGDTLQYLAVLTLPYWQQLLSIVISAGCNAQSVLGDSTEDDNISEDDDDGPEITAESSTSVILFS